MESAPELKATLAALIISGKSSPLAFLNVAIWSIFTPSFIFLSILFNILFLILYKIRFINYNKIFYKKVKNYSK